MIDHFKIQYFLGLTLGLAVTIYYFGKIFQTGICFSNTAYIPATGILPVIGAIIAALYVFSVKHSCEKAYTFLIEQTQGN
jgi:Na+/glutamate symporter